MKMGIFLIVVFSFLSLCCRDIGVEPRALDFSEIPSAQFFRVQQPGTAVFRSEAEWKAFRDVHFMYILGMPIMPPIADFEREIVIGIFWGTGYGGCRNVTQSIERVQIANNVVEVKVGPLSDLGSCKMLVAPLQIVKIPKTDLPVVFVGNVPQSR